jgi:hypothetical protein
MKYDIYAGKSKLFVAGETVDVICFEGKYYVISGRPSGVFGRYRVLHLDHLMHYYEFHTTGWCDAFRAYFWQLREKTLQFLEMELSESISRLLKSRISIGNFHGEFENHPRFFSRVISDLVPELSDETAKAVVWSMDMDETGLFYPACNVRSEANSSILLPPRFANLEAHMGVLDQTEVAGDAKVQTREQQMMFADDREGHSVIIPSAIDEIRMARDEVYARYENFFSRPLKLNAYKWQVGGTLFADINPWDDYLSNPIIINRVNNFKLMRATLCFKVVVSGTPFHYGRAIACYQPLHRYDTVSQYSPLIQESLVRMTNLPKVFIDPSDSSGGYMEMPFFYHRDYLNITKREWINLGNIYLRTLNILKHANNGTDDVTVTTFAWLKDVELAGATSVDSTALVPQMGEIDEANASGMISGPATKVAGLAAKLGKVPYIAPYADATSALANGVSSMAKLFGMSRPPHTKDVEPMKPESTSSLALTTVPDRSAKLSVDDKQEMSIDPRLSGVGSSVDPLSIQNIVSHESWFTTFDWPIASGPETFLFNVRVNPMVWREAADVQYLTATAFAALPFNSWSGTMEYRIQVVCSKMHNGKLRIVYDPNYASDTAGGTHDQYLTSYSKVIDLRHQTDCTMAIPMNQVQTFMEMPAPGLDAQTEVFSTTRYTAISDTLFNGTLSVYVLNELTTPSSLANNDVQVNVYVKGGKDLCFREPTNMVGHYEVQPYGFGAQLGEFQPQLGEVLPDGDVVEENMPTQEPCMEFTGAKMATKVGDVYYGEIIESFRPLLKRFNHHERITINPNSEVGIREMNLVRSAFPRLKGFMPEAVTPTTAPVGLYNFVNFTLLNYITLGFAGHRGSIRWKFFPETTGNHISTYSAAEHRNVRFGQTSLYENGLYTLNTVLFSSNALNRLAVIGGEPSNQIEPITGYAGAAINHSTVNSALEIEIPYYTPLRFEPGKRTNYEVRDLDYDRGYPYDRIWRYRTGFQHKTADAAQAEYFSVETWVAAGEDFTTYFFTGAPPLIYRATLPTVA